MSYMNNTTFGTGAAAIKLNAELWRLKHLNHILLLRNARRPDESFKENILCHFPIFILEAVRRSSKQDKPAHSQLVNLMEHIQAKLGSH